MAYSEKVVHKAVRLFTFAKQEIHLDWTLGIDKLWKTTECNKVMFVLLATQQ